MRCLGAEQKTDDLGNVDCLARLAIGQGNAALRPYDRHFRFRAVADFRAGDNVCVDRSWADDIDADAVFSKLKGQLLRHGHLRCLGRAIGGRTWIGESVHPVDRRYDDDCPASSALQERNGLVNRQVGTAKIDAYGLVPFGRA